ncbi:Na/Pi cotransporter family protein [Acetivibrio ethanolgignens]|uniref:Na/Pi cotransporter n=1 Tax=Acetivibrio ethanolgignens TaxID=290052 RepID=A0A0V8QEG0_9FIRM|nr:Na/Pi cotransporter family protein [Acetivibrio ethanolgignens]KSV58987.1 Na/Pi cotransporter [Acetivibrio ethanolgignens]
MSMNDIEMLFKFAGGLGLFLYGMNIMADGLQKAAGNKMKSLLGILTGNRFLAVLVGALVTAIIQSSSATTVMVVGFVNAGLMDLTQAVGVIMGANIGTTITAWLVSMNELGDILKPEFYAPVLVCIGAFLILFSTKNRKKQVGEILVGFGALFIGLSFMSGAITPYRDAPVFANAFMILGKNPILGILTGAVVTAIIQSSSASVGILQTLALNGMVNWGSAIFITLGQNIGTCITALLSGAGAHRTAKRAAVIHFLFNVIGTLIFGTVMFLIFAFNKELANAHINSVQISVFHTIFNITNTIVLFPFANYLVKLSGVLVRGEEEEEEANPLDSLKNRLDRRILESPTFAIETAEKEVANMGSIALKNIERAKKALLENDSLSVEKVVKWEQIINGYEEQLTAYLAEISNLSLNDKQHIKVKNMLYTISDMERVGDHCENLSELAAAKIEKNLEFSPIAAQDLEEMMDKVLASYEAALMARITGDVHYVDEETAYENIVDDMEKQLREKHFVRLAKNECNATIGVYYIDAISNLERISDHADNIAHYVVDEV